MVRPLLVASTALAAAAGAAAADDTGDERDDLRPGQSPVQLSAPVQFRP